MDTKLKKTIGKIATAATLFCALLLSVARTDAAVLIEDEEYLTFGAWNHSKNASNQYEGVDAPILWQKKPDENGLYVSVYLLEAVQWHQIASMPVDGWLGSDIYTWLNSDVNGAFYGSAFNAVEKQVLKQGPDNDTNAWVTLPDMLNGYDKYSRFRETGYRAQKTNGNTTNKEYWLRRPYNASPTEAWGVGPYGKEGPGNITAKHGIRPLISINLDSILFKTGSGTLADPYVLYGASDAMKPAALSVQDNRLLIEFGTEIGAVGTLPASDDFTLLRNGEAMAIAGVEISAEDPKILVLTLAEAALYGEAYKLSYSAPTENDGLLSGGALRAVADNAAMGDFSGLSVRNETLPTLSDVIIAPSILNATAYRAVSAEVTIANATGGNIRLNGVTATPGWPTAELTFSVDQDAGTIRIEGTPTTPGQYTLNLDVAIQGTQISGGMVVINVSAPDTNPTEGSVLITPNIPGPAVLRQPTQIVYTVSSTIADAWVQFEHVAAGANWSESGLSFEPVYYPGGNTLTVKGTPTKTGSYSLFLDVCIDGTLIRDKELVVEVVYPPTNPTSADIHVTSDLEHPIVAGQNIAFTYTVGSSIKNAEVVLEAVKEGGNWAKSGLALQQHLSENQVEVYGVPAAAGVYALLLDVRIDGVTIADYPVEVIVGNPPGASDLTFTPEVASAKIYRPYRLSTTISSRTGDAVALHDVTARSGWEKSGLSFTFDETNAVTILGMPIEEGRYSLKIDATIGDTRVSDGVLYIDVLPAEGGLTSADVLIVPSTADPMVERVAANVGYTVTSAITDAYVELVRVKAGANWSASGLDFGYDPARARFSVYGIPQSAGRYQLLTEIKIDGVTIPDYPVSILVIKNPEGGNGNDGGSNGGDGNGSDGGNGSNGGDGNSGDGGNGNDGESNGGDGNGGDGGNGNDGGSNGGDGNGGDGGSNGGDGNGGDGGNGNDGGSNGGDGNSGDGGSNGGDGNGGDGGSNGGDGNDGGNGNDGGSNGGDGNDGGNGNDGGSNGGDGNSEDAWHSGGGGCSTGSTGAWFGLFPILGLALMRGSKR